MGMTMRKTGRGVREAGSVRRGRSERMEEGRR